jgi:hypothetical protein
MEGRDRRRELEEQRRLLLQRLEAGRERQELHDRTLGSVPDQFFDGVDGVLRLLDAPEALSADERALVVRTNEVGQALIEQALGSAATQLGSLARQTELLLRGAALENAAPSSPTLRANQPAEIRGVARTVREQARLLELAATVVEIRDRSRDAGIE